VPHKLIATVKGHCVFRELNGSRCHIWAKGIGIWADNLSEQEARAKAAEPEAPVPDQVICSYCNDSDVHCPICQED
jgi:hypothetical protein